MKILLLSALLLLSACIARAQSTNCNLMVWNPSLDATNDPAAIYKFYWSTNLNVPLTNWTLIGWCSTTTTNTRIAVLPGVNYFYGTLSNFWGESVPSNVASTPAAPLPPTLRIERIENP